ncbi:hypothetical protein WJX72_002216 [[Myrmecia] bisecta]|uniref:Urea transporter n=1 Tax=[Myrmecia] bisecta TaxID=41462 RepID=A0AAW1PTR6_9CHLO
MATGLVYAAYISASVVAALFGLCAILFSRWREHKQGGPDSTEFFLTARKSVGALWIGWSFYAAALGSWALFSVPSYAYLSGILGLVITRIPVVLINGIIAMAYTAYGGLYVSIVTDQAQAVLSVILLAVLFIFVAVTFRQPLPHPLPSYLGPSNYSGLSSIAVMPISLASSTVFSEAMWQRCWASKTDRKLIIGATGGFFVTTVVVFLYGFGGFLAAWSGLFVPVDANDYGNTILFSLLDGVKGGRVDWVICIVAVLAATMSLAAVDSLQNAIVDNISGVLLRRYSVWWSRALVVILNIPPIIVSLQSYNIISLFLIANLVTTTSTLPLLAGLLRGYWARRIVTSFSMLSGCALGLTSLFVWAKCSQKETELTYSAALHRTFFEAYDYPPFLLALGFSVVGLLLGALLENALGMLTSRTWPEQEPSMARKDDFVLYSGRPKADREQELKGFQPPQGKAVPDAKAVPLAS